jgi:hypothetical protein
MVTREKYVVEEVAKALDKTTAEIDQIEAEGWLKLGSYECPKWQTTILARGSDSALRSLPLRSCRKGDVVHQKVTKVTDCCLNARISRKIQMQSKYLYRVIAAHP